MFGEHDLLVRAALYPRFLSSSGEFDYTELFSFPPFEYEPGKLGYAASVGARALLPTMDDVHHFGCRTAAAATESERAKKGADLIRPDETVHYRGSYELNVAEIRTIDDPALAFNLVHVPEADRMAHCHIELRPKNDDISKSQKGKARTRVIARLTRMLKNPAEYICPEDEDIRSLLETVHLHAIATQA